MILPNDLFLRTTPEGKTLWVSQRLVVEYCNISEEILRMTARKRYKQSLPPSWQKAAEKGDFLLGDSGKAWRWGRRSGSYYYDLERIPDRAPACYRSQLPSREELLSFIEEASMAQSRERKTALRNALSSAAREQEDMEDVRWLNTQSGYLIKIATCREYARALGWCRFITRTVREGRTADYGLPTVGAFYAACAEILQEAKLSNFHITTPESLRKKLRGFPAEVQEQRRWIISLKLGNQNHRIVGKQPLVDPETGTCFRFDIHQAIMYRAYMNPGRPEKEHLQALYDGTYVPAIESFGIAPISFRSFCNHLSRLSSRLMMDMDRHGKDHYRKHLLTYTPTEKLTYAHSLFAGDGSALIRYSYFKPTRNKKGRPTEELSTMNLYAILISDVASGYIAGYGIAPEGSHKETYEMMRTAVRMAVRRGGEQTMLEFVSDNHTAFDSKLSRDFLQRAFNRVRRIEAGNSQANPAETLFRLFKNTTLRSMYNFVRTSHTASVSNRANLDDMTAADYPDYLTAVHQFEQAVERWNNTPRSNGKTPSEMFACKHPECKPLDAVTLRSINGERSTRCIERMRGFIKPRSGYLYEIPDYATKGVALISQATGNGYDSQVECVYDATGADLYSLDGRFILSCPPSPLAKMAAAEKTPDHALAQRHHSERKKEQLYAVERFARSVERADSYLKNAGYEAIAHFSQSAKEEFNGNYEEEIDVTLKEKTRAKQALRRQERTRERTEEKLQKEQAQTLEGKHLAYLRSRIPEEFLNK